MRCYMVHDNVPSGHIQRTLANFQLHLCCAAADVQRMSQPDCEIDHNRPFLLCGELCAATGPVPMETSIPVLSRPVQRQVHVSPPRSHTSSSRKLCSRDCERKTRDTHQQRSRRAVTARAERKHPKQECSNSPGQVPRFHSRCSAMIHGNYRRGLPFCAILAQN